ncbi:MAG: MBL fold metallo-hydrolase [Acidobacteriota bacterium]
MITNTQSGTTIDEIGPSIYRISTPVDIPAIPGGFTFNQYLIVDQQPLLFHTGYRRMFPLVSEAISKVMPLDRLRYAGLSHFEADECGSLNDFLAVAPQCAPVCSDLGALVSVNDAADRPARGLASGEEFSIGSRTLQWIYTPHVPHGWDCGVLFDKSTGTLFCGDLFTQGGSQHAPVTTDDVLATSEQFRQPMDYYAHARNTGTILENLAELNPKLLACMHGSAFQGDAASLLRRLAKTLELANAEPAAR